MNLTKVAYYVKIKVLHNIINGITEEALVFGKNNLSQFIKDWCNYYASQNSDFGNVKMTLDIETKKCEIFHPERSLPDKVIVVFINAIKDTWVVCRDEAETKEFTNQYFQQLSNRIMYDISLHKNVKVWEDNPNPSLRKND
jgi:hypothetical protein